MDIDRSNADDACEAIALADAYVNGGLSVVMAERLEQLVLHDPDARRQYVDYLQDSFHLHRLATHALAAEDADTVGAAVELPHQLGVQPSPFTIQTFPTIHYPLSTIHLVLSSYLMAAVIVCLGLLIGSWWKVSDPTSIALLPSPVSGRGAGGEGQVVGRITGMADCKWAKEGSGFRVQGAGSNSSPLSLRERARVRADEISKSPVALGDHFALSSGLLEITYNTGAKVILQGPVNYQVESNGGFLSLGKLTGKLENKVVSGQWPVASLLSPASGRGVGGEGGEPSLLPSSFLLHPSPNPQSLIPNPFVIHTPTAAITDLGTEFGIEVSKNGALEAHVFDGAVTLTPNRATYDWGEDRIVRAGSAVRLDGVGKPIVVTKSNKSSFVRALSSRLSAANVAADAYADLVLSMQPVIYYRMEQPKDERHHEDRYVLFDSAPGGHHGVIHFAEGFVDTSPYARGRFGQALRFRGPVLGDYAIVPDYPKATDNRLTVSAWVISMGRLDQGTIVANWRLRRLPETSGVGQFLLAFHPGDNSGLSARIMQRNGEPLAIREGAAHPFPAGTWQHVALVADGAVMHLYHNGVEVASNHYVGILPEPPKNSLTIGCKSEETSRDTRGYWQGLIDEVAVFNRALSVDAIRRLAQGTHR
jgi:hypothetical protein